MKPRVEIRLSRETLAFAAWDRERHEEIAIPLRKDHAPLISMLVQLLLGCERLPDQWTLVIVGGELVIQGPGHRQSFALGSREADTRLDLAALVAACAPDGGDTMLERIAKVQRLESRL